MRLWSIHPKYLDPQGLVALWREGLLAKRVLEGKTKGYRSHPQLDRFRSTPDTTELINFYLHSICDEADKRGYKFDRTKLSSRSSKKKKLNVTRGQIDYEWSHLLKKLFKRSRKRFYEIRTTDSPEAHPIFRVVDGEIEDWEVLF